MENAKSVVSMLPTNNKLSGRQSPKTKIEKVGIMKVPYASTVGRLMYAMVCTRPDIGYIVGVVSRYTSNLGKEHCATCKWILRYLKDTSSVCLRFGSSKPLLEGFTDSDILADMDTN